MGLLLMDAGCLLNLYATRCLRTIAAALPFQLCLADCVLEQEALYVRHTGPNEAEIAREPVDLASLFDEGIIQLMRLEHPGEEVAFVELTSLLIEAEAMTGALALHRGDGVASDDRKARRVLGLYAPSVPLFSTLELLKLWTEMDQVSEEALGAVLVEMQSGANYIPGKHDPLYRWWQSFVPGAGS